MSELESALDGVETRDDLAQFINSLAENLRRTPDAWENANLLQFLRALAAWTQDMDGYFLNQGVDVPAEPSWKIFAMMLMAARVYE